MVTAKFFIYQLDFCKPWIDKFFASFKVMIREKLDSLLSFFLFIVITHLLQIKVFDAIDKVQFLHKQLDV